jgi:hypothetical protein
LFIGERRTYVSPQIDDIFLDNNRWIAGTTCGIDPETTPQMVRMRGSDFTNIVNWQRARNAEELGLGQSQLRPRVPGHHAVWHFSG